MICGEAERPCPLTLWVRTAACGGFRRWRIAATWKGHGALRCCRSRRGRELRRRLRILGRSVPAIWRGRRRLPRVDRLRRPPALLVLHCPRCRGGRWLFMAPSLWHGLELHCGRERLNRCGCSSRGRCAKRECATRYVSGARLGVTELHPRSQAEALELEGSEPLSERRAEQQVGSGIDPPATKAKLHLREPSQASALRSIVH